MKKDDYLKEWVEAIVRDMAEEEGTTVNGIPAAVWPLIAGEAAEKYGATCERLLRDAAENIAGDMVSHRIKANPVVGAADLTRGLKDTLARNHIVDAGQLEGYSRYGLWRMDGMTKTRLSELEVYLFLCGVKLTESELDTMVPSTTPPHKGARLEE